MRVARYVLTIVAGALGLAAGGCEGILGLDTPVLVEGAQDVPMAADARSPADGRDEPDAGGGDPPIDAAGPEPGFVNGSFELDSFEGWTLEESTGDPATGAWAVLEGGTSINPSDVVRDRRDDVDVSACLGSTESLDVTATEGTRVAGRIVSNRENGRIYQDLTIPAGATTLRWDMAYRSRATFLDSFQSIVVQIRDPESDSTILATLFETVDKDPITRSMQELSADISAFAGQRVRIDVEITIQLNCMDVVLDDFTIQ